MDASTRIDILDRMTLLAEVVSNEAQALCELVDFIDDADVIAKKVSYLENEADVSNHMLNEKYRGTDIVDDEEAMYLFNIFAKLEECTDVMDKLATSIVAFNVTHLRSEMIRDLVDISSCAVRVCQLVDSLKDCSAFADSQRLIIAINHFRDNATKNYATNMRELFINEKDAIEVIRWKEILTQISEVYTTFEHFADCCEDYLLKSKI